ncbi:MAG: hypothetical protein V9G04_10540 [Nocardioides sp.]|jgi:ABC-type transport system involved in cytochrome c biogenesis permease subunit
MSGILFRAAGGVVLIAVAFVALAALADGRAGATGAGVGAAIAIGVLLFGSVAVNLVARITPSLSLLVALMTYALQLLALIVIFTALHRSNAFGAGSERAWLAGGVVVATLAWTVVHLAVATRTRIPVYDEPSRNES